MATADLKYDENRMRADLKFPEYNWEDFKKEFQDQTKLITAACKAKGNGPWEKGWCQVSFTAPSDRPKGWDERADDADATNDKWVWASAGMSAILAMIDALWSNAVKTTVDPEKPERYEVVGFYGECLMAVDGWEMQLIVSDACPGTFHMLSCESSWDKMAQKLSKVSAVKDQKVEKKKLAEKQKVTKTMCNLFIRYDQPVYKQLGIE